VAVNLFTGSSTNIDLSSDSTSGGAAVNISSKGIGAQSSHIRPAMGSGRAPWSGQLVSFGVPKTLKMVSSWDISVWFPYR